MPRSYAKAVLLMAPALMASQGALAVSPIGATAPTETGGGHSLGKKEQFLPPPKHKDVIPPPVTGDEGI